MASPLETLPGELLDGIFEALSTGELVNLWKSSRQLSHRLEHALYGTPSALHRTMRFACSNGETRLIQEAISHGANPSIVHIRKIKQSHAEIYGFLTPVRAAKRQSIDKFPGPYKASTLAIAARQGHLDAFTALLGLGASLDGISCRHQRKALAQALNKKRRGGWSMMHRFLDAGLGPGIINDPLLRLPASLVPFITHGAPVDLVRKMLQSDADPNQHVFKVPGHLVSPLSASIALGATDIVGVLLERGADIHGSVECRGIYTGEPDRQYVYRWPGHVPIFAAAKRMGVTGLTDMMDLCLSRGADINCVAPAEIESKYFPKVIATTPLIAYLESIKQWPVQTGLKPRAGIDYFLSRGAQIRIVNHQQDKIWPWLFEAIPRLYVHRFPELPPLETLLLRRGIGQLRNYQFFDTIEYLVERGAAPPSENGTSGLLSRVFEDKWTQWEWNSFLLNPDHPIYVPEWWALISLLMSKVPDENRRFCQWLILVHAIGPETKRLIHQGITAQEEKDQVLFDFVHDFFILSLPYAPLAQRVVERMQVEGADINGRGSRDRHTILFTICQNVKDVFVYPERRHLINCEHEANQDQAIKFCVSLVRQGADPFLRSGDRTCIDVLVTNVHRLRDENKHFLLKLAQGLKDERKQYLSRSSRLVRRTWLDECRTYEPRRDRLE